MRGNILHYEKPKKSKIRVELWAPYLAQNNRPIHYVEKNRFPEVYAPIERSFDEAWTKAETMQLTLDAQNSQP